MPLENYQFNYRGITFGSGTDYEINQIDGLDDLNARIGDRDFPRQHGQIPGIHLANYRLITVDLEVGNDGFDAGDVATPMQALLSILSPDQGNQDGTRANDTWDKFTYKLPGEDEMFIRCRPTRRRRIRRADTEYGFAPVTFQLRCSDPRKYHNQLKTSGAISVPAGTTIMVGGHARAYPVITYQKLNGNTTGLLRNTTTGVNLDLINLVRNRTYTFNMDFVIRGKSPVVFSSGANETGLYGKWKVPREPFYLGPGMNALDPQDGDTVTIQWYDTYL